MSLTCYWVGLQHALDSMRLKHEHWTLIIFFTRYFYSAMLSKRGLYGLLATAWYYQNKRERLTETIQPSIQVSIRPTVRVLSLCPFVKWLPTGIKKHRKTRNNVNVNVADAMMLDEARLQHQQLGTSAVHAQVAFYWSVYRQTYFWPQQRDIIINCLNRHQVAHSGSLVSISMDWFPSASAKEHMSRCP